MNAILECDIVLSKKLEAVCDAGEPISIQVMPIAGNKGHAIVRLTCKPGISEKDLLKIGETSLMFKINSATDDIVSLEADSKRVGNIVGGVPTAFQAAIARTSPDVPTLKNAETGLDNSGEPSSIASHAKAYVGQKNAEPPISSTRPDTNDETNQLISMLLDRLGIPKSAMQGVTEQKTSPSHHAQPKVIGEDCLLTYDDLMLALHSIPNVDDVPKMPTDRKMTPRETELVLSQMPKLRKKAFLRNKLQSQLMIGDLFTTLDGSGFCLALLPGAAFDLTRIPARNILNSTDLKWCFDTGKVELVNSAAYIASFKKVQADAEANEPTTLQVFSGDARKNPTDHSSSIVETLASGAAMADDGENSINVGGRGDDAVSIPVGDSNDLPPSSVYEENAQIQALIGQLPRNRTAPTPPRRI